ncbi:MAG: helix-turn-helix domain-containing protein [Endozoicomonas sp.]
MDWLTSAQLFVLSQGILLCVVILSVRGGNRTANTILALYIALNTTGMFMHLLIQAKIPIYSPLYGIFILLIFKGPLLFLYVRSLTDADFRFNRSLFIHALCIIPGLITYAMKMSAGDVPATLVGDQFVTNKPVPLFLLINSSIILAYGLMSLRLLETHRSRLENTFSAIGPITLNWLKWLIIFVLAMRLTYMVKDLAMIFGLTEIKPKSVILMMLNFGVIYFIAIGGLRQPMIFSRSIRDVLEKVETPTAQVAPSTETDCQAQEDTKVKYQKSALGQEKLDGIWTRLITLFDEQKTYMQEDLNLSHLADLLEISSHELSQAINMKSGSNFYELVNRYRIDAAKELLENPQHSHRKLLDIAMEVGYKSQSTFYSQFNKQVGMTPKRYRDQCLASIESNEATS